MSYYYLAGPMRGIPEFNFPAFKEAAYVLRKHKIHVVSPAEKDEQEGFDWSGTTGSQADLDAQSFNIAVTLAQDIELVAAPLCQGVICLEGWENSSGARAETAFAWAIGKKVYRFWQPDRNNGYLWVLQEILKPDLKIIYGEVTDEWAH
jgi:hypothetical protein